MKKIPNMPQEIIDAIDNHTLLIFVGAGLSKLFGYPLWNELAKNLVKQCVDNDALTRSQSSVLLSSGFNSMQLVTIAFNKLSKKKGESFARSIVSAELEKPKESDIKVDVNEIAEYLSNYFSTVITTNADPSLDNTEFFKDKNIINDFKTWDEKELPMIDLFHLHGFIKEFDSLVFTSQQYATAYMADAAFGKNLQELFKSDRTVLFIGYGVAEFELIRYFLRASNDGRENLFMLSGYLKKDDIKREFDEEYFGSLGIRVLPYSIESKDYAALKDVLKEWDKVVRNKTVAHLKPTVQMKEAFKAKPTTKSLLKIKNCLK